MSDEILVEHAALFGDTECLLIQNELPSQVVQKALTLAWKNNVPTVLNFAPFKSGLEIPVHGVDVLIANESEAANLLQADGYFSLQPHIRAKLFRHLPAANVVVTLGGKGCEWYPSSGDRVAFDAVRCGKSIDSLGAGDAFSAALAVSLTEGLELPEALEMAQTVAACSTRYRTAQAGLLTREELIAELEELVTLKQDTKRTS
jgi:ribokinase